MMTVILPQFLSLWLRDVWMTEFWNFFQIPCIVRIYAWFFMHCRNHHSDSHANHVINLYFIQICIEYRSMGYYWLKSRGGFDNSLVPNRWLTIHEHNGIQITAILFVCFNDDRWIPCTKDQYQVTRKMFPFDDIMYLIWGWTSACKAYKTICLHTCYW